MASTDEPPLTAAELAEIAKYEEIVKFAQDVLLGVHPRVKVPERMQAIARKQGEAMLKQSLAEESARNETARPNPKSQLPAAEMEWQASIPVHGNKSGTYSGGAFGQTAVVAKATPRKLEEKKKAGGQPKRKVQERVEVTPIPHGNKFGTYSEAVFGQPAVVPTTRTWKHEKIEEDAGLLSQQKGHAAFENYEVKQVETEGYEVQDTESDDDSTLGMFDGHTGTGLKARKF